MNHDPFLDKLRGLPVPPADESAKARALHRSLAALGTASAPVSRPWGIPAWKAALPVLAACLAALVWIGATEHRHAEDTAALRQILGQMEATFQNQLAAVVLTNGQARVVLSKEASSSSDKPVLLTLHAEGTTTKILTFSGRWFDLPLNGATVHVQVMETGAGRVVLAGDGFLWDGSPKPINGLRIQGRFL